MSMRQIYKKVAKEYGVTVAEVKRDMQAAIDAAYMNPDTDEITAAYQNRVPRKGEVPTPEELIKYAAQKIREEQK